MYSSFSSWFLDNSTEPEQVTYLINAVNLSSVSYKKKTCDVGLTDNVTRTDVTFSYRYEPCPRSGCPKPGDKTGPLDKKSVLYYHTFSPTVIMIIYSQLPLVE